MLLPFELLFIDCNSNKTFALTYNCGCMDGHSRYKKDKGKLLYLKNNSRTWTKDISF